MDIKAILVHGEKLFHGIVQTGAQITYGSGKKDSVIVEDFEPKQITVSNNKNGTISIMGKDIDLKKVPTESIVMLDEDSGTYFYFTTLTTTSAKQYTMPYRGTVKLGRNPNGNDIVINLPFVSNEHLVFKCESGNIRVEDLDSTNGTFLNGQRFSIGKFKPGDEICILSLCIRFNNGKLTFEGTKDDIILKERPNAVEGSVMDSSDPDRLLFHKSPRVQESLPSQEIIIANPPAKGQKYEKGRGAGSMLIGSTAMIGASALTGMMSPALLAARSAALISPVTGAVNAGKMNKKRKKSLNEYIKDRKEKYGAYIEDQKALIGSVAAVQRNIITLENPAPDEAMRTVLDLRRDLWERMPADRDFMDVRIGMGYEDLCVPVKSKSGAGGFQMEDDEAENLVEQIVEETRIVDNIPARIPLLKTNTVGFIGERKSNMALIRNMLICMCSAHSFEDVKLIGIFDKKEKDYWKYLRWIPHFWDEDKENCMLAFDEDGANSLCDFVSEIIASRQADNAASSAEKKIPAPFYVFIIGSKKMVENHLVMNSLFANDPSLGLTTLFLYDDIYALPPKCKYIVDMSDIPAFYNREVANEKIYFSSDKAVGNTAFDKYVRTMSAIKYEGFASRAGLPKSISFLEGYGVKTVEQLNVFSRWSSAVPDKSLAAPIGKLVGDETLMFDIHEKAHGPHGLVAGTTGSGKSELLQTWILSMACNYHPHQVAFVLIDYKGGGMANLLEPLPHVVGKITNIGSNIQRSLISLQSEIVRRQVIFDKYQKIYPNIKLNHIDSYQKLFREGKVEEPLPHLIIVADEFAELKKEEPDFMAGLVKAARVGRSLGIHLVLATQKPGGIVDDQIQSNSRFRLCLKVQDSVDSREMLERGDAAFIREAGRGFIRVGKDEYFEKFQSYWSGAPYYGNQPKVTDENPIRYVDECGRKTNLFKSNKKAKTDLDELTAVVNYICRVSEDAGIVPAPGPWLPELPELLSLDDLNVEGKPSWLKVPVGMYDIPARQEQGVQMLDFAEQGHHAVYGAPGTGKTTFLKTLVTSMCRYYTPEDISIYVIDCGGWGMSVFADMPHVGGIVLDYEEEKLLKLEQMIREEFNRRKMLFLRNNVTTLAAYRSEVDNREPAIMIIIDNILPLFDMYPDIENFLIKVANEGTSYGIYLVYSANSTSGVRYKVIQNMKGAVSFELTDRGDFANIVGRLNGATLPPVLGRAFARGTPPVEFQGAMFAPGLNDKQRNDNLRILTEIINREWTGKRATPIPVMPDVVSAHLMLDYYNSRMVLPVGISRADISPAYVDLTEKYCFTVTGDSFETMSRTVSNIASLIKHKYIDTMMYVFDSERCGLSGLAKSATAYAVHNDNDAVTAAITEIISMLNSRKNEQKAAKAASEGSFSEQEYAKNFPLILVLIDDIKKYVDDVTNENVNSMERICRLAQHLGVIVITSGSIADVTKNSVIETLTSSIVSCQNGLAVTGTPNQITFFKNNLKYNEKDIALEPGNGYLFVNGDCRSIKYIEKGENL